MRMLNASVLSFSLLVLVLMSLGSFLQLNVNCKRATTTAIKVTNHPHKMSSSVAKLHYYTVLKVSDGDTATLKNNTDGEEVRVRFLCIDAPEKSQGKWGAESLKKLAEILPLNSRVTLHGAKIDLYGRTVSEIINDKQQNVNKKMIELGLAVHYVFQKGCDEYKELEKVAKSHKKGVWSDSKFEMPWEYRERNGIGARGRNHKESATTNAKKKVTEKYEKAAHKHTKPATVKVKTHKEKEALNKQTTSTKSSQQTSAINKRYASTSASAANKKHGSSPSSSSSSVKSAASSSKPASNAQASSTKKTKELKNKRK